MLRGGVDSCQQYTEHADCANCEGFNLRPAQPSCASRVTRTAPAFDAIGTGSRLQPSERQLDSAGVTELGAFPTGGMLPPDGRVYGAARTLRREPPT